MTDKDNQGVSRRDIIKLGAAAGGVAAAGQGLAGNAWANRHPAPRPTSLKYLDRNMYRKGADVRAIFEMGRHRGNKMQMMAIGERRFIFQGGDVFEVTNALKPVMVNQRGFAGGQLQLAYNGKLKKWILMTGARLDRNVLDAEVAEWQVRQSRPYQAQHRAEGPARRALL